MVQKWSQRTSRLLFFSRMRRPDSHPGRSAYSEYSKYSKTIRLITAGEISQADSVETQCGPCVFVCDAGGGSREGGGGWRRACEVGVV